MKQSILDKLDHLQDRYEEVGALLSDAEVISDQNRFRELSKEYAEIEPVVKCYEGYTAILGDIEEAKMLLKDGDADMREMAQEELKDAEGQMEPLELELQKLLLPKDPNDDKNVFLEIRAGTGGDEAAIFSGDLFRMYSKYAETRRWKVEIVSQNDGDHGGFKEIITRIVGQGVYSQLKFESGAHRVQRVPETESGGRIHTSAATVAVLPEAEEVDIEIRSEDIRIDTMRASGAGGQHVNTTDSAVRMTHLPTGTVTIASEKSQHQNRARAMQMMRAKLYDLKREAIDKERSDARKGQVGSGDRSERIRTYNFPQGRMTDHRINLTLYKLAEIVEGELSQVIDPLVHEHQADLLASLNEQDNA